VTPAWSLGFPGDGKGAPLGARDLTPQEAQIVREGLTNPEIGARLFISPRTIEWHLRKTFGKLGITSRKQLQRSGATGAHRRPRGGPFSTLIARA
jgi:DNA-binding CsgD family transcriptional regulator